MARHRTGPSPAELALLGLLAEGPSHPYSLESRLRSGISSAEVAFSSVYAALDRLERFALVRSKEEAGQKGRARRVYSLTASGLSTLTRAAREALARPFLGPRSNDLGVAGLLLLSRDEALEAIAEARQTLRQESETPSEAPAAGDYPQDALALHRKLILEAENRFYDELQRIVESSHPVEEEGSTSPELHSDDASPSSAGLA